MSGFRPLRWALGQVLIQKAKLARYRFQRLTRKPRDVQRKRLFAQLRREAPTAFGKEHGFGNIRTLEDYRRQVPITRYEYYRPYIERVQAGEIEAMFHRQKVIMFAMTSGTTAHRKYVPVTERFLKDYRRGWTVWGLNMFESHPELWFTGMVQLASNWDEFRTPAGIPCGSISGLTAQMQHPMVRKNYIVPAEAATLKDTHAKYYLAWRLGLVRNIGTMVTANPSTMINLARFGDQHRDQLIRDVAQGTVCPDFDIPQSIIDSQYKRLAANTERARELENIVSEHGNLYPKNVWPKLGLLGNWTGGSVGGYMRHYPTYFGSPAVRDIGLIASEGRMTIPIEDNTSAGILEVGSCFFEFVPVDEIDSDQPTVLESHELQEGHKYYILLTTSSGFYRYNIFDVVRCEGWHHQTPLISFLNKGQYFSSLTGEKLSEHQVVQAVQIAADQFEVRLSAFTLAPCWEDPAPYYGLFVEEGDFQSPGQRQQFADEVENQLRLQNDEYKEKRDSHRLAPIRLELVPAGFWRKWDTERLTRTGGTMEQYKHPCLISDTNFRDQLPLVSQ